MSTETTKPSLSTTPATVLVSPNTLKRKKGDDTSEEQLEAEIKRVALEDADGHSGNDHDSPDNVPSHVHLRMLCLVKHASLIVGHKGATISRIKSETSARINVSNNIRGVPERIVYVRGTCDDVAKAYGMIVRALLEEHGSEDGGEDIEVSINLLIPHHLMGCIIGKRGSRLREIEDLSAAKLFASPNQLLLSNDRILTINGVPDAIHIATFYVSQTLLNFQMEFPQKKLKRSIYYQPTQFNSVLIDHSQANAILHQRNHQYHPNDKLLTYRPNKNLPVSSTLLSMATPQYTTASVANATAFQPNFVIPNVTVLDGPLISPGPSNHLLMNFVQQEIFIDEKFVGNVIGKDGKHINSVKESTGCSIIIQDPVEGSPERRLTIRGTFMASQAAIMLIGNKIEIDRSNAERKRRSPL
ncbi:telomere maintenance protein PBP2 [Saccharomyces paradoxus]|uniref:Telomere maintenance protein PBP2 n=1 Tax=Saccharomyces paradoxus TaxID=27291 RepID=A0A8B8UME9_SACPA|nr:Pbp2 [Saccharomyces paradoxus]QHS71789.1 Pbp2 [Saccharomyces paradoxus]